MQAEVRRSGVYGHVILKACLALFVASSIFFAYRAWIGLTTLEFTDEMEQLVAAQMVAAGGRLYSDVWVNHGPLTFMLAHLYASLVSASDFSFVRVFPAALAALCLTAVVLSPALIHRSSQLLAAMVVALGLGSCWMVQSLHMLIYHALGAFLFSTALAFAAIPAVVGRDSSYFKAFIASCAITALCFSSYSFGLAATLLVLGIFIS